MYHDGCKYARGGLNEELDRFRMEKHHPSGQKVDNLSNDLASKIGPLTGKYIYLKCKNFMRSHFKNIDLLFFRTNDTKLLQNYDSRRKR